MPPADPPTVHRPLIKTAMITNLDPTVSMDWQVNAVIKSCFFFSFENIIKKMKLILYRHNLKTAGMAWHDMLWCGIVWYTTVWYTMV